MKPIAPNTLIQNRYLIVHLIGKGGMGEVYLAVDQRLGSAIALKRTFFSDDATLGHAFEREARTLARLRHPVLPKVSDHFTEEGTQYLVMEHISGDDISKRLETSQKPFPVSWVLFWADQLLDALNYLHSHEPPIIHRDIKPQNLKLTDENHIVLLDFGLSKNSVGETRVTTAGSIVGYTPHYAPMEQIRGTGTDARSDIYSLAATLYQILTNTVPPDALTRADSLINGMPDPVPSINELNPEVSRAVSDVIIKGMAISQEQRYKTAREMQKALRDAYAQLQTGMSAQTVAFTNQAQPEIPQTQQKTAQISSVPPVGDIPPQSQIQPQHLIRHSRRRYAFASKTERGRTRAEF
jgi:serine/threonine protein kinase